MELFWYIVLVSMLAIYMVLDGYDFGVGIIYLFFAKTEADKKALVRAIGPFWDANEVWLIAAGGVMFFAFPKLYASAFSGFYLPLIMILWLLIFRAIGLEFRNQVDNTLWHTAWDTLFGVSSLLLALFFGLALGNIVRGVNMGEVINGVSLYEPIYFLLPLWNPSLNPLAEGLGIIDWFTLILGIIGVVSLIIHGANWIIFKTNASINTRLKTVVWRLNFILFAFVLLSLFTWDVIEPNPFHNFNNHFLLWFFPLLTFTGLFGLFNVRRFKKDGMGFLFSTLFLIGGFASTVIAIFPNFLPSTNTVNPALTLYNTAPAEYGLRIGQVWFAIGAILIALYFIIQYRVFRGKMDEVEYGEH